MNTTKLLIQPESLTDYAEIAALHLRAFGNRADVPPIVALQRQRREFDPELSLVAKIDGRMVGHVLFSPYRMRLLSSTISAVNLSPIAVEPAYQGQGIGGRLIREGHAVAASKGSTVSILLGHPTYYPRFGYHTHAFGSAQLALPAPIPSYEQLEVRGPTEEDVSTLCELWQREEQDVDMALEPGRDLLDWLSPHPAIKAVVYTTNDAIVGYTRLSRDEPTRPQVFLARDADAARAMVSTIAQTRKPDTSETEYILPLHPLSASTATLGEAQCSSWEAGMACELGPSLLPDYLALIREKRHPVGRPIWPVAFDLS